MIKAGVIGLGHIGMLWESDPLRTKPCTHLGTYARLKEKVRVEAVCDIDPVRCNEARAFCEGTATYTDYREMVRNHSFDILSICTPEETHHEIVIEVVKSKPKAIFLEKPIAPTVEQASSIISACKDHKVKLVINHSRRWSELYQRVSQFVRPELLMVDYSGDVIRVGVHVADLVNWFHPEQRPLITHIPWPGTVLFEVDLFWEEERARITENGRRLTTWELFPSKNYDGLKEFSFSAEFAYDESLMLNAITDIVDSPMNPRCTGEDGRKALELALSWKKRGRKA